MPSVNPELEADGAGEGPLSSLVAEWLEGWGFHVRRTEVAPGRFNVVAELGHGSPRLLLSGHLDTVGVDGMTLDPFDARLLPHPDTGAPDALLPGRGSADMKGGIAALLVAARTFSEEPRPPGSLVVLLTADEEHASLGLEAELAAESPEHPLLTSTDLAIVCEPTELAIAPANKGFVWTRIVVHGRAAHGSRPEQGRDAIRHVGRILAALDGWAELEGTPAPHPLLGTSTIHAGVVRGGTSPSVYPARCELVLEARTLPGESAESVHARVQALVDRAAADLPDHERPLGVEVEPGMERPPAQVSADSPGVDALARAIRHEGGIPRVEGMTAWVEGAWLIEAGIPALSYGPGSFGAAHTADETCPTGQIETAARVLSHLARTFGSTPGAPESTGNAP